MKYVLTALVGLFLCAAIGCGDCCQGQWPQVILKGGGAGGDAFGIWSNDRELQFSKRADGAVEVVSRDVGSRDMGPVRDRVIELPEDGGVWHTILIYPDRNLSDAASRTLSANMASTPRLQSLVAQTKKHVYTPADPWVKRWMPTVPTPSLIVMRNDGGTIYKASGRNLPGDGEQIADDIQLCIYERRWIQRVGGCTPDNCPNVERPKILQNVPDMGPSRNGGSAISADDILLLAALGMAAAVIIVWVARRK
jgi:hypothetical protein